MRRFLRLLTLASLALPLQSCTSFVCDDEVTARTVSPDGRWLAASFVRNCGATSNFITYVTIVAAGDAPDDSGKVFAASAGAAPQGPSGGPQVRLRWLTAERLSVVYDPKADVSFQAIRFRRLTIEYGPRKGAE